MNAARIITAAMVFMLLVNWLPNFRESLRHDCLRKLGGSRLDRRRVFQRGKAQKPASVPQGDEVSGLCGELGV